MCSISSLPLHPGLLGVIATESIPSIGQIELLHTEIGCKQMTCWIELLEIEQFEDITECRQMTAV